MNSQHARVRRASARALVAAVLLAGVIIMHGLTGNHDAVMAIALQMPATTSTADHPTQVTVVAAAPGHQKDAAAVAAHSGATGTGLGAQATHSSSMKARQSLSIEPSGHGHLHAMGDVCLAMLAALLLALIVALARQSLTVAHPIPVAGTAVGLAPEDGSPPWRRPTLSKLCVLRT